MLRQGVPKDIRIHDVVNGTSGPSNICWASSIWAQSGGLTNKQTTVPTLESLFPDRARLAAQVQRQPKAAGFDNLRMKNQLSFSRIFQNAQRNVSNGSKDLDSYVKDDLLRLL